MLLFFGTVCSRSLIYNTHLLVEYHELTEKSGLVEKKRIQENFVG